MSTGKTVALVGGIGAGLVLLWYLFTQRAATVVQPAYGASQSIWAKLGQLLGGAGAGWLSSGSAPKASGSPGYLGGGYAPTEYPVYVGGSSGAYQPRPSGPISYGVGSGIGSAGSVAQGTGGGFGSVGGAYESVGGGGGVPDVSEGSYQLSLSSVWGD